MKKSKNALFLLLAVSGIIFLFAGVFLTVRATEFHRKGIKTQAQIVSIESDYDGDGEDVTVIVKYTVDGATYTEELNYYSSKFYEGLTVPIYYLPDDPNEISYAKAQFLAPVLFFAVGGICLAFGAVSLISSRSRKKANKIKEKGKKVIAVIKSFDCKRNVYILGKSPATLICEDSSKREYRVKFLNGYGNEFVVGENIDVYLNCRNENEYAVDLEGYLERKISLYVD